MYKLQAKLIFPWLGVLVIATLFSCQKDPGPDPRRQADENYLPVIRPEFFSHSTELTHPYFPLQLGAKFIYEGQTEDGFEHIEVEGLAVFRQILGIDCVGIIEKQWLNGKFLESTLNWFAQDLDGNVWCFGEEVEQYNSKGKLINRNGSWEAGLDGALAGLVMPVNPHPGQTFRLEYHFNLAEDEAKIVATDLVIYTPLDVFYNCLKIIEWSDLEPGVFEYKYYAPEIGLIKEEKAAPGEEILLVDMFE